MAQPPEQILNLSTAPHPGPGTASSRLNACSSLLPGVLASILPHWQSVMHQEPEGAFKDVSQIIPPSRLQNIPGASCCHPNETHLPAQPPKSPLLTSVASSVPTSPLSPLAPATVALFSHLHIPSPCHPRGVAPVTPSAWNSHPPRNIIR